jgi:hypothetical protein
VGKEHSLCNVHSLQQAFPFVGQPEVISQLAIRSPAIEVPENGVIGQLGENATSRCEVCLRRIFVQPGLKFSSGRFSWREISCYLVPEWTLETSRCRATESLGREQESDEGRKP